MNVLKLGRIILAADELGLAQCLNLVSKIGARIYAVKIHNLFDLHGPKVIKQLRDAGARRIWVDAKLHDIPNTVKLRAAAIAKSEADILTVHASGGVDMMRAAKEGAPNMKIYAITVLTSLDDEQVKNIYGKTSALEQVLYLASMAGTAGLNGLVCSSREVGTLGPIFEHMDRVVPGVRSAGKDAGDQKRIDTPAAAIKAGATHLVVGRQITQAVNPLAALNEIEMEVAVAESEMEGGKSE